MRIHPFAGPMRHVRVPLCLLVCLSLGACGGKVDWVASSGSGVGGAGGAATVTTSTMPSPQSSSSSSTGAPSSSCADYCAARDGAGCETLPDCPTWCGALESYFAPCADLFQQTAACNTKGILQSGDCIPEGCEDVKLALGDCAHPPGGCETTSCSASNECKTKCGPNLYVTQCEVNAPGDYDCACFLNDQHLGDCHDIDSIVGYCCTVFFAPGP